MYERSHSPLLQISTLMSLRTNFSSSHHLVFLLSGEHVSTISLVSFCVCRRNQNSGIEKAFLFDVVSKIYIATDSSPVDMQSYELCCDMIDVVIDVSCIYG